MIRLHPVGQKQPLLVDGNKAFYDMYGNVDEVMFDSGYAPQSTGVDASGSKNSLQNTKIIRGGNFSRNAAAFDFSYRQIWIQNDPSANVGFRLVREISVR